MLRTRKIRVLECIRQGKIGGGESYLLSLVENMDKGAFEPVVLSFTDGPMIERLQAMQIPTHVIHTEKPFDVGVWNKVRQLVIQEQIDIVHAHGTRANSNVFWAAKKQHLPLVYTCHAWSFHPDQNFLVKKIRIGSERFLTSRADVNICGSVANGKDGQRLFPNFQPRIIYNSIDPKKFDPSGHYKNIRAELGLGEQEIVIVSVARFTHQKQPLKLIEAFSRVVADTTNVKLLMVGDGELKPEAEKMIARLNLEDKIILQPFRNDVPDVLAAADIFVLPSLWEAFPIALLEAMSMGKAVIATNVDGTPEIIQHNENGLLIPVEDMTTHIQKNLIQLLNDESLRKRLQNNARKSIHGRYNTDVLARENEKIYYELLSNN